MFFARLSRLAFCAALLCVLTHPADALQLGETRAQLVARHGNPGAEDHARHIALYSWEGWSAQVEFQGDVVSRLMYKRNWYLQESEIISLLQSNGGTARWKESSAPDAETREWTRDDGALASCARTKPLTMVFASVIFEAEKGLNRTSKAPKVVIPASPSPAYTRTPTYPRMLVTVPEPELPVADSPTPAPISAAPISAAPLPTAPPASLPKLPVEELPAPASATPVAEPAPEPSPAPRVEPSHTAKLVPHELAAPAVAAEPAHGSAYGFVGLALLLLVGAAAGGYYFLKRRSRPRSPRVSFARTELAPAGMATLPGLDALRWDPFELLIGEIFRREGYTVEMSAAPSSDNGIDLTLRRDSETILVQCKHWRAESVGEGEVREFYGAMAATGAPRGVLVTTGTITEEAREFAAGKSIELMDGAALAESVAGVARPGENLCRVAGWIEEFTAHARIFDPECPVCQGTMIIRHNRANGTPSWTCRSYPSCPGRREPRLDLLASTSR